MKGVASSSAQSKIFTTDDQIRLLDADCCTTDTYSYIYISIHINIHINIHIHIYINIHIHTSTSTYAHIQLSQRAQEPTAGWSWCSRGARELHPGSNKST